MIVMSESDVATWHKSRNEFMQSNVFLSRSALHCGTQVKGLCINQQFALQMTWQIWCCIISIHIQHVIDVSCNMCDVIIDLFPIESINIFCQVQQGVYYQATALFIVVLPMLTVTLSIHVNAYCLIYAIHMAVSYLAVDPVVDCFVSLLFLFMNRFFELVLYDVNALQGNCH